METAPFLYPPVQDKTTMEHMRDTQNHSRDVPTCAIKAQKMQEREAQAEDATQEQEEKRGYNTRNQHRPLGRGYHHDHDTL